MSKSSWTFYGDVNRVSDEHGRTIADLDDSDFDFPEDSDHGRLFAAAPDYYAATEWIKAKIVECSHSLPGDMTDPMKILARVEAVPIPSLMLRALLDAHAKAEGGQP